MAHRVFIRSSMTHLSLNDRFTALRHAVPPNQRIRRRNMMDRQATRRNQRLAIQMENRPGVKAALNNNNFQRRGRGLSRGAASMRGGRGGRGRGRGRGGANVQFTSNKSKFPNPARSKSIKKRLGNRGSNRGGGFGNQRGSSPGKRFRGARRARRPTRGRGGNFSRGRGGKPANVSKETLDNELESYMSKTKTHLDAELDAYMGESKEEKEVWD